MDSARLMGYVDRPSPVPTVPATGIFGQAESCPYSMLRRDKSTSLRVNWLSGNKGRINSPVPEEVPEEYLVEQGIVPLAFACQ
jgi:hypothetical protein